MKRESKQMPFEQEDPPMPRIKDVFPTAKQESLSGFGLQGIGYWLICILIYFCLFLPHNILINCMVENSVDNLRIQQVGYQDAMAIGKNRTSTKTDVGLVQEIRNCDSEQNVENEDKRTVHALVPNNMENEDKRKMHALVPNNIENELRQKHNACSRS
jgi:hypothetical protein